MPNWNKNIGLLSLVIIVSLFSEKVYGIDHVTFRRGGTTTTVSGKTVVEAEDGGQMVMTANGHYWLITAEEIIDSYSDEATFKLYDSKELEKELLSEFSDKYRVTHTDHFVICHNTTDHYAKWCGLLFESLYEEYYKLLGGKGLKVDDVETPMVVLLFNSKMEYERYSRAELGDATDNIIGFYSQKTNRIAFYDLTGVDKEYLGKKVKFRTQIRHILKQPQAERLVATLIHEATHQIILNSGLQKRYADIPLWIAEGLAVYFESPNMRKTNGWNTPGRVNRSRLIQFRQYGKNRPANSVETLIQNNTRCANSETAADAYAEAWALTHYLFKKREKDFIPYLKELSKREPLVEYTKQERLDDFRKYFGDELDKFDKSFLRYVSRLR
ncbi:MAG: DUF1570 domain-containing protein [Pirellulaceae bacterium]|nr:DUF1570 domain-containing protein [Pirellulaceae bacterium]